MEQKVKKRRKRKEKISQIDLVIVSTCYSQDLGELFKEFGVVNSSTIEEINEPVLEEAKVL